MCEGEVLTRLVHTRQLCARQSFLYFPDQQCVCTGRMAKWIVLNNSKEGSGAALHIFYFVPQVFTSQSLVTISNTNFMNNVANQHGFSRSFGGAVFIGTDASEIALRGRQTVQTDLQVSACTFANNLASHGGGAVYSASEFVKINISGSVFRMQELVDKLPAAVFILASGSISIDTVSLIADAKNPTTSLVELEMSSGDSWIEQLDLSVACPPWQNLEILQDSSTSEIVGKTRLQQAILSCLTCPAPFFLNSDGQYIVSYLPSENQKVVIKDSLGTVFQKNCIECPIGAECPGDNLLAKPNFWGIRSTSEVVFHQCPIEYCCQKKPCKSYNQCSGNRAGTLCGSCERGYSLSALSQSCIRTDNCTHHWLWFAAIIGICAYMLWYTFKGDALMLPAILKNKLCQKIRKQEQPTSKYVEKYYFSIMIYFTQVSALMRISNFQTSERFIDVTIQQIESYVGLILSIEISYISGSVCVLENMTTTTKTMFKLLFLFGIYLVWCVMFSLAVFCAFVFKPSKSNAKNIFETLENKLIFGLVEIIKYTYLGFTFLTFYSLTCVSMDVSFYDNSVWLYDSSIECYDRWQIGMIIFGIMYVVPYPLVLFIGLRSLKQMKVTRSFFLSVFFPLPVLIYWSFLALARLLKCGNKATDDRPLSKNGKLVYEAFTSGYRESKSGTQYWECVIMLRRFLISLSTFMPNPMIKLGICLGLCVAFLFHHSHVKPFAFKISNNAETLSLVMLVGVAFINLLRATFIYLGVSLHGVQIDFMNNLGLLESTFVFILGLYIISGEFLEKVKGNTKFSKRQKEDNAQEMGHDNMAPSIETKEEQNNV